MSGTLTIGTSAQGQPLASQARDSTSTIRLTDVSRTYSVGSQQFAALSHINLSVASAESVAIVGRSGSGKSTLLNVVTGIDRPTAGTIRVGGAALETLSENQLTAWRGANVGIVFQSFQLLPTLTVLDNLLLAMDFVGTVPRGDRGGHGMELLDRVGLAQHARKLPGALSGGEQQRVAIARSLANNPTLIVADEPTGNLDSTTSERIVELLLDLVDGGRTLLLITHDAAIASRLSRKVTLADGVIVDDTAK